ncbi:hypothetical protein Sjap_025764 [Stephania japonica]|uniref:Pentatricopeptide repeat-containing protein n=1 Tax=Stephania japonica TaxID=461633 RepID=A0AAP0E5G2_9MAGN
MHHRFRPLNSVISREFLRAFTQPKFKSDLSRALPIQKFVTKSDPVPNFRSFTAQSAIDPSRALGFLESDTVSDPHESWVLVEEAKRVQSLLKFHGKKSLDKIEKSLDQCGVSLSEELVLMVLRRHRSDWRLAYSFFNWAIRRGGDGGYEPSSRVYNEMLDILGRLKRFQKVGEVFDEMSKREGLVNERTMGVLLNRYAAADKVEEATELFYRRKEFGLPLDLVAFQNLLMSLCRHKHVEAAEFLFRSKRGEFRHDIKSWNIILNGWCVFGSLRETKRFWNEIVSSRCKRDLFTYGIFINSLTKAGKLSTAIKLFHAMWKKGCTPDVAICNCIIDALCFKKRIPEALEIFGEMNEKGCLPDVATYNSLIKHLCKIRRMEKVHELLDEMEKTKGRCMPNPRTYSYLLKSLKKPEEVPVLLERMKKNGCVITADIFNLMLKLFMDWNDGEGLSSTWFEMERNGLGPDQRSYTIMIHGLHGKGKMEEPWQYFQEMRSKGLIPEPRTKLLVEAIKMKLKGIANEQPGTMNADGSAMHEKKMGKR